MVLWRNVVPICSYNYVLTGGCVCTGVWIQVCGNSPLPPPSPPPSHPHYNCTHKDGLPVCEAQPLGIGIASSIYRSCPHSFSCIVLSACIVLCSLVHMHCLVSFLCLWSSLFGLSRVTHRMRPCIQCLVFWVVLRWRSDVLSFSISSFLKLYTEISMVVRNRIVRCSTMRHLLYFVAGQNGTFVNLDQCSTECNRTFTWVILPMSMFSPEKCPHSYPHLQK